MDKASKKNMSKNTQKGMSRAEFAQEYSLDHTNKTQKSENAKQSGKTEKCQK